MSRSNRKRVGLCTSLVTAALLVLPAVAHADLTVDDPDDDHAADADCSGLMAPNFDCTLRDAIALANMFPASHAKIDFSVTGEIGLTMGDLEITDDDLTIEGPGADQLTINGGGTDRIFTMISSSIDVTLSDLTLSNGNPGGGNDGGAVFVDTGSLTILRSEVNGNDAQEGGGLAGFDADLIVRQSTFTGNAATLSGGAINANQSRLTVENSTISGNMAPNIVNGTGGGITVTENFANDTTSITGSTVSGNSAGSLGGGIAAFLGAMGPDPVLTNTIVADNTAPFPSVDLHGPFDASFSLIEVGSVTSTVPGSNITGQDPQLGLLVNNGGPTLTSKPAASSPAIDKGSTTLTTDQRGKTRPLNAAHIPDSAAAGADGADIGAVELTGPEAGVKKCGGKGATIIAKGRRVTGTNKADVIVGTAGANVIKGKGGRDRICGLGGKDTLIGGGGPDTLIGGAGADILRGGPGRDKLKGGPGRDTQRQ